MVNTVYLNKAKQCSHNGFQNAASTNRSYCAQHWAEYIRTYNVRADKKRENAQHFQGFSEGVTACVQFLRKEVGDRAFTGHTLAHEIEKKVRQGESGDVLQRRALIESLRGVPQGLAPLP